MKDNTKIIILLLIIFLLCIIGKCSSQTIEGVKSHLNTLEVQNSEVVLRQIILETGWLSSYSCKHRHNLFGFRYKGRYLEFNSWEESVEYYARWQKRHYKGGDYYEFLKEVGYATDPKYITKLKQIKL